jgi:hypothetical protein
MKVIATLQRETEKYIFHEAFIDSREVKIPGSVLRVRVSPFCLPILPVISTRFPAVNHGLHVKEKRVRVFSIYYLWAA